MDEAVQILVNEIRYAERLCQRTARLYRRLQVFGTFATVLGGGATLSSLSSAFPVWLSMTGAIVFAAFGAGMLAIRPADKAAANEADVKRYAKLKSDALTLKAEDLRIALNKARESDASEVEPLRDVAYNDLLQEVGQDGMRVSLKWNQKLLAVLA